ncbi:MAG: tryptophan synthase subunit alpha [Elusimicrobia bacterium]|nr:tryptophan synthase subunit alpha [Elusimicrobiota bacterium]
MRMTLAEALAQRRARGRAGFVPFLVAGDPSYGASLAAAREAIAAGADVLEVGVPFSDPVADGPVIQAAGQRALDKGMVLTRAARFVKDLRRGTDIPIVLFTYLNPVLRLGWGPFAALCARSRVTAVLIVDLPAEESAEASRALARRGIELVLLASPTTSDARLRFIGRAGGSVVYYVSREGVTGVRSGLAPGLAKRIKRVRALTGKPLMVGFGVASPDQARALAPHADGVVVGSALVKAGAQGGAGAVGRLARRLVAALETTC